MAKEIANIRVDQKKREVKAYARSLETTEDREKLKLYESLGYKVTLLEQEKPSHRKGGVNKEDLKIYLDGKINKKIYADMVKKIDNNENFLKIKSWLKTELQKDQKENYIPFNTIIAVEKAKLEQQGKINGEKYINDNKIVEGQKEET